MLAKCGIKIFTSHWLRPWWYQQLEYTTKVPVPLRYSFATDSMLHRMMNDVNVAQFKCAGNSFQGTQCMGGGGAIF
jgi:hypothetical protein